MYFQNLYPDSNAHETACVGESTSDLELFDEDDEPPKEVALNEEATFEALEAPYVTDRFVNSMKGSAAIFQENLRTVYSRAR